MISFIINVIHFLQGLNDISVYNENDDVAPANPFLKHSRKENSVLDVALQVLSTITARKAARKFLSFIQHLCKDKEINLSKTLFVL